MSETTPTTEQVTLAASETEALTLALMPPVKWMHRGTPDERVIDRMMDRDDAEWLMEHLGPVVERIIAVRVADAYTNLINEFVRLHHEETDPWYWSDAAEVVSSKHHDTCVGSPRVVSRTVTTVPPIVGPWTPEKETDQ